MKHLILPILLLVPFTASAAGKATFSVFGTVNKFSEVTCRGIAGHPGSFTFRLPASEESQGAFEAYVGMIAPYKLVVTASRDPSGRTLYLAFAREDATPTLASTKGLDLALRIGSGMDVYCELNDGAQITKD